VLFEVAGEFELAGGCDEGPFWPKTFAGAIKNKADSNIPSDFILVTDLSSSPDLEKRRHHTRDRKSFIKL
jgi:hypothetical protein